MYIIDTSCISSQPTYPNQLAGEVNEVDGLKIFAQEPNYTALIPRSQLRRMSKLACMCVATGMPLIERSDSIDGIIMGSSNGSMERSLRFLNQIIEYNEGTLTPTDFVQSTQNSLAGNLAIMGNIRGYNATHVNQGLSFESALLDALMLFQEGKAKQLLVGAGEELSEPSYNIESQRGMYKLDATKSSELLDSGTPGNLPGEGMTMFTLSSELSDKATAEICDVHVAYHPSEEELVTKTKDFLSRNGLNESDIDTVIFGRSGDSRSDRFFDELERNLFKNQRNVVYKHLTGDYYCASAYGVWLGSHLLRDTPIPNSYIRQDYPSVKPKNVLLYNNYEGRQHGMILMKGCPR